MVYVVVFDKWDCIYFFGVLLMAKSKTEIVVEEFGINDEQMKEIFMHISSILTARNWTIYLDETKESLPLTEVVNRYLKRHDNSYTYVQKVMMMVKQLPEEENHRLEEVDNLFLKIITRLQNLTRKNQQLEEQNVFLEKAIDKLISKIPQLQEKPVVQEKNTPEQEEEDNVAEEMDKLN